MDEMNMCKVQRTMREMVRETNWLWITFIRSHISLRQERR